MPKLSTKQRDALCRTEFGLPSERKYPINDANHARNAISRASQQENAGNITPAQKATIDRKARAKLKGK